MTRGAAQAPQNTTTPTALAAKRGAKGEMIDLSKIWTMAASACAMALGTGIAAPAATFQPPKGCTGFLTVQSHGCMVSNHYRCTADAPGDQWRADFGVNGPFFVSRTDRETRWMESADLASGTRETLEPGAADPASFTGLLATGFDDFDFRTRTTSGAERHYTGHDKLTGQTVTIDGVTLKRTEYAITARNGSGKVLWRSTGHEYIQPAWRMFLSGTGKWIDARGAAPFDNSPAQFAFPGQPGFMSTVPVYDCDTMMSALPTPPKESVIQ